LGWVHLRVTKRNTSQNVFLVRALDANFESSPGHQISCLFIRQIVQSECIFRIILHEHILHLVKFREHITFKVTAVHWHCTSDRDSCAAWPLTPPKIRSLGCDRNMVLIAAEILKSMLRITLLETIHFDDRFIACAQRPLPSPLKLPRYKQERASQDPCMRHRSLSGFTVRLVPTGL